MAYARKYLRKKVLERDGGICAKCGRYDAKFEADHILALWNGGADALDNLQTLCRHCHLKKSVGETPIRAKTDRLRTRHETTKRRRKVTASAGSKMPTHERIAAPTSRNP